jgi:hypothetical protein
VNKDLNDVSHRLVLSLLGGEYTLRKESIRDWYSCECFIITRVNDSKFVPDYSSQDLFSFDSLSRDWILKLDPNDNFRN